MKQFYKVFIRTNEEQRIEVIVEAQNLLHLTDLFNTPGHMMTFISKKNPDRESFSLFKHDIKRLDYQLIQNIGFERSPVYAVK